MSNPVWMRFCIGAVALSMFAVGCGDDDPEGGPQGDPCDESGADFLLLDCDEDGLTNGFEIEHATNDARTHTLDWKHPDVDGNGIVDGEDDWDVDGLPNRAEEALGMDPFNPHSVDAAVLDGLLDSDGDGSINMAEAWAGTPMPNLGVASRIWDVAVAGTDGFTCTPDSTVTDDTFFSEINFRFTSLTITVPGMLGGILNTIMGPDINIHKLNVIAPTRNFDFGSCVSYFELFAGGANCVEWDDPEAVDGTTGATCLRYEMIDLSENANAPQVEASSVRAVVVQLSENTAFFQTIQPLNMIFPGTLPGDERFFLQLEQIFASGMLSRGTDGVVRLDAFIDGGIPFEAAQNTMIRLQPDEDDFPLGDLLTSAADYNMPVAVGADRNPMGHHLRATFSAVGVDLEPIDTPPVRD